MKKALMILCVALLGGAAMYAQQIAVVSPSGNTNVYQTLDEAINSASNGSVIYLPGGGSQIKDETKITKRLTIVGVSHKVNADNADGATTIGGNLWFEKGSDGSAVMGVFLTGDVNIGTANDSVQNITVRYCNINSVQLKRNGCHGITINQCYVRNDSNMSGNNVKVTNCIIDAMTFINAGIIDHNVIVGNVDGWRMALREVSNSTITNNIMLNNDIGYTNMGNNNQAFNNMSLFDFGSNNIQVENWDDIFEGPNNGVSITSNFNLKSDAPKGKGAATDGTDVGIYGGDSFDDNCLAPIPRIVSKKIDEQTDGSGKLTMKISVKAY